MPLVIFEAALGLRLVLSGLAPAGFRLTMRVAFKDESRGEAVRLR